MVAVGGAVRSASAGAALPEAVFSQMPPMWLAAKARFPVTPGITASALM
jgi:hypothetical protein